jgi:hypothetical protein
LTLLIIIIKTILAYKLYIRENNGFTIDWIRIISKYEHAPGDAYDSADDTVNGTAAASCDGTGTENRAGAGRKSCS